MKREGTKDRALGHTWGDRGRLRSEGFDLDELSAAREAGVKPEPEGVRDAYGRESTEEGGVRNSVEGCTQVEEDEDGD